MSDAGTASVQATQLAAWGSGRVNSIAVDATSIYLTGDGLVGDTGGGTIMRMPKTGGTPSVLVSKQDEPGSIAVDGKNIYWATKTALMKAELDGREVTRLVASRDSLRNVTLDASNVYWTATPKTGRNAGRVMKLAKVGGRPVTLASEQNNPGSLALVSDTLYWTGGAQICKLPLAGGSPTALISSEPDLTDMAVDGTNVYWMTWTNATLTVKQMPLSGGAPLVLASRADSYSGMMAVAGRYVYWTTRDNEVNRTPIGGGPTEVLNTETMYFDVFDLAVDDSSVYWADFAIWNMQHSTVSRVMRAAR